MPYTRLSSKGQVVLPKSVREALGLKAGDELLVQVEDGTLRLIPKRKQSLSEVLDRLPGHAPKVSYKESEELLLLEKEEAKKRWRR